MTGRARGRVSGALAAGWAAFIFWESSRAKPFPFLPEEILAQDKVLHFLAFGLLGALLAGALARTRVGPLSRAAVVAAILASGYGASDEWHQAHVPGRTASRWDWLADTLGAAAGAAAVAVTLRRRNPRASIRA